MRMTASRLLLGQEGLLGVTALVRYILDKLSLPGALCCSGEGGMEGRVQHGGDL